MKFLFRADASIEMGVGHIMRCLTLADALAKLNILSHFVCQNLEGHLQNLILEHGHSITLISPNPINAQTPHQSKSHCFDVDQLEDAIVMLHLVHQLKPDWLVVDHYGLDHIWENELRKHISRVLVIDDLANRQHSCDVVLDQNIGRLFEDYAPLIPRQALVLTGTQYALLRPEFADWRSKSLAKRQTPKIQNILVSMGGTDGQNATSLVLKTILQSDLSPSVEINVIMGENAPWLFKVEELSRSLPMPVNILTGISDVARVMHDADIAFGAAGSTSWERCAMGIPSITIIVADNQRHIATGLADVGAALCAGDIREPHCEDRLKKALDMFIRNPDFLATMSSKAAKLADGLGTDRVIENLLNLRDSE